LKELNLGDDVNIFHEKFGLGPMKAEWKLELRQWKSQKMTEIGSTGI